MKVPSTQPMTFGKPASDAMENYQTSLIAELGFDPSSMKSAADFDANKDAIQQFEQRMQEFSNTDPTILAAKSAQQKMNAKYAAKSKPAVLQDYDTAAGHGTAHSPPWPGSVS